MFKIRPGCVQFLNEMSNYFELIVFTAADQSYADEVLDKLDLLNLIKHRLYRQHTVQFQCQNTGSVQYIKDLSKLGRDLEKCIIVDNLKENFCW